MTHTLLQAMKAAQAPTLWERVRAPKAGAVEYVQSVTGTLVLSHPAAGGDHFDPYSAPPVNPPPPTGGTAPALPGSCTVDGNNLTPYFTTTFSETDGSPPAGTYWFQSPNPGAGDNAIWPGNLAKPGPNGLEITTEMQNGKVASGGWGCGNGLAQNGQIDVTDMTIMYGGVNDNLVRYKLRWPLLGWPGHEEDDDIEGGPGFSRATWHGTSGNQTVGHILQPGLAVPGVWYCVRTIRVLGPNGYMQTLVGPDWDHLVSQSLITAAMLPTGFDTTPHVVDIAVEAEGPIDQSLLPVTDTIGGVALYTLAA